MSDVSFAGKAVIVTGAGGGLGRQYALELGRRGASVVVNDPGTTVGGTGSDDKAADGVVEEIRAAGGTAVANHAFVGTPEAADEIIGTALSEFGKLDAVISNAGILIDGPFADVTPEDFRKTHSTHLEGSFWVAQRAFRAMRDGGGGRIVLISSNSGIIGATVQSAYAAAKSGILGLTKAIALEGAEHGILANAVLPVAWTRLAGVRETPTEDLTAALGSAGERLTPENVMPLGVFLASEACTSTGQLYSAVAARYARVVIGVTDGWLGDDQPSVDDLAEHWDEVVDRTNVTEAASGHAEIRIVADRIDAARKVA